MIIDETITNIQRALAVLRSRDPQLDAHLGGRVPEQAGASSVVVVGETGTPRLAWTPPVIGAPLWFLEEVATHYGQEKTDYLVDELCGLKVIQREQLGEPILVMGDGTWYTVVPEWARRTAEQIQAEEFKRRVGADAELRPGAGPAPL